MKPDRLTRRAVCRASSFIRRVEALGVGLDVDEWRTIQDVQPDDMEDVVLDPLDACAGDGDRLSGEGPGGASTSRSVSPRYPSDEPRHWRTHRIGEISIPTSKKRQIATTTRSTPRLKRFPTPASGEPRMLTVACFNGSPCPSHIPLPKTSFACANPCRQWLSANRLLNYTIEVPNVEL